MSRSRTYLERLPKHAQKRGSAAKGEVEIVTSRRELKKIEAECAEDLKGSALGKGGKRIGILLEDEVRLIVRDALKFPSGATRCQMRVIGKTEYDGPNGVVALCLLNGRFLLRETYRHPTRAWELETLRGRRETGQTSRQAVRLEVKQELGYTVKRIHLLGRVRPESALMSSTLEVFLAELRDGPRRDDPEESEAFGRIHRLKPGDIADRILRGEVRDNYTIVALMLAQLKGFISAPRRVAR